MEMQITLQVSEELGQELEQHQDQLVEILELGLRDIKVLETFAYQDENTILEILANQPEPHQVLALKPSPKLQARVSELLDRAKTGQISGKEEAELERYLTLERLVRLAKAYAAKKLKSTS
jgi:hypothetical protein